MTIALLERTRDIGIMKAMGVKDRDVSCIFLFESALIATSGGVLGVVGGWLTSKVVNMIVNILAKSVGGEPQKLFSMPIVFSMGIIIFSIIVGIGTGFYPSKRASKLNPLDALRYE
jgi:putative ABC transport system permease protein